MVASNPRPSSSLFDVDCLDVSNNKCFGLLPIPTERDEQISNMLRKWMQQDEFSRRDASHIMNDDIRPTLLAYSERAASRAVREKNEEPIVLGLLALGVDGWSADWRENVLLLCLHFDAAKKIGSDPGQVFANAAKFLSGSAGESLRKFVKREPKDQSLEAMRYRESADSDGFRYQRNW